MSDEPSLVELRQMVIEASLRGLRRTPRRKPARNRLCKPNPQWDAMLAVSAGSRDIMNKVRGLEPAYIVGGFIDDGQRARNLASIRECRDFLSRILNYADTEAAE
jgi:hypothetical protein